MSAFTELFGDELQGKEGKVPTAEALKDKKFVFVYFSAHWCPPCKWSCLFLVFIARHRPCPPCKRPCLFLVFIARHRPWLMSETASEQLVCTHVVRAGRGFTPVLAEKYKAKVVADPSVEVVFVSSDRDQAGFDGYYGEMPWLALPFDDRGRKQTLGEKFGVRGIPMLVVLDGEGALVTTEGRGQVDKYFGGGGGGGGGGCSVM